MEQPSWTSIQLALQKSGGGEVWNTPLHSEPLSY